MLRMRMCRNFSTFKQYACFGFVLAKWPDSQGKLVGWKGKADSKWTQSGLQYLPSFGRLGHFPRRSKVLQIVAPRVVDCAQEKRIERFIEFLPERDSWFAPFLNVLLVQFFGSLEGLAGPTCYVWIRSGILRDRDWKLLAAVHRGIWHLLGRSNGGICEMDFPWFSCSFQQREEGDRVSMPPRIWCACKSPLASDSCSFHVNAYRFLGNWIQDCEAYSLLGHGCIRWLSSAVRSWVRARALCFKWKLVTWTERVSSIEMLESLDFGWITWYNCLSHPRILWFRWLDDAWMLGCCFVMLVMLLLLMMTMMTTTTMVTMTMLMLVMMLNFGGDDDLQIGWEQNSLQCLGWWPPRVRPHWPATFAAVGLGVFSRYSILRTGWVEGSWEITLWYVNMWI